MRLEVKCFRLRVVSCAGLDKVKGQNQTGVSITFINYQKGFVITKPFFIFVRLQPHYNENTI